MCRNTVTLRNEYFGAYKDKLICLFKCNISDALERRNYNLFILLQVIGLWQYTVSIKYESFINAASVAERLVCSVLCRVVAVVSVRLHWAAVCPVASLG